MARDYRAEEQRRNEASRAAGFTSRAQERRVRKQSTEWSSKHASHDIAKFRPVGKPSGYVKAYYDAFINPKTSFKSLRKGMRATPEIRHYFVDVMHYMTADEYDQKYGAYVEQWAYHVKCRQKDGFSKKIYFDEELAYHAAERHREIRGPGHSCTITRIKV